MSSSLSALVDAPEPEPELRFPGLVLAAVPMLQQPPLLRSPRMADIATVRDEVALWVRILS